MSSVKAFASIHSKFVWATIISSVSEITSNLNLSGVAMLFFANYLPLNIGNSTFSKYLVIGFINSGTKKIMTAMDDKTGSAGSCICHDWSILSSGVSRIHISTRQLMRKNSIHSLCCRLADSGLVGLDRP